ncbi:MAG: hypothetical protein ACJ8EU_21345, partial [Xanthobacteraceae bacterium]
MVIEWHTHVYPPEEAAGDAGTYDGRSGLTWAGRCPMTVENVLDAHHKAGLGISVVSNAAHYLRGKPGFQLRSRQAVSGRRCRYLARRVSRPSKCQRALIWKDVHI